MDNASEEPSQRTSFLTTWLPLATAAALTGVGPLAAYAFELGRAAAYDIPPTLVRTDATTLLSFALAMVGFFVIPAAFFVHSVAVGEKQVMGRPVGIFFGVAFLLLAISPILEVITRLAQALALLLGVFVIISTGVWVANRINRNLQRSSAEHRLVFQLCLCAIGVGAITLHLFWSGWRWERSRVDHLVLRTPEVTAAVARVYGDEMVCVEFGGTPPKLTGKMLLIKTGGGYEHPLTQESVGVLRR